MAAEQCVVRASSPDQSGQDGLTTQAAAPMVVAIIVLVQMLYVQDLLNTDVTVTGEKH